MKFTIQVEVTDTGIHCKTLQFDAGDIKSPIEANTLAIGALDIARAALLAQRWGINVGDFNGDPLVKEPPKPKRRRKTGKSEGQS